MKTLLLLLATLICSCSALELADFNFEKLADANDFELKYELLETVYQDNKEAVEKARADVYVTVSNYQKARDVDGRQYSITIRDSKDPKQHLSLKVFSNDGGRTLNKMALLTKDGQEEEVNDKQAMADYQLFPTSIMADQKTEKSTYKSDYPLSGKRIPVEVMAENCTIPDIKERAGLVLQTDSECLEKKYLSSSKSLPILLKHETIVNTNRYAYHNSNTEIRFKRLAKKSKTIRSLNLISYKSSGKIVPKQQQHIQPNKQQKRLEQH